eukprot:m.95041 g.95041  ORF g.95041 m.95041 type:complete len:73 (+) comp16581_c0_seq1:665-883(+)
MNQYPHLGDLNQYSGDVFSVIPSETLSTHFIDVELDYTILNTVWTSKINFMTCCMTHVGRYCSASAMKVVAL